MRATLLDAGREAASTTGLRRTPVEQLTRAAGVSKGAFYLFFESKEAMVFELLREVEAALRAEVVAAVDQGLGAVLRCVLRGASGHPLLRAIADPDEWAWLAAALPPGALEAAQDDDDAFFAQITEALTRRGALRPGFDPRWLGGLGSISLAAAAHRTMPGAERIDATWEAVIDGLVARWGSDGARA